MACDLHTHTNHSDGAYSPRELVRAAKELNLTIALTDHNTVTGLPEFLSEAERLGVNAISGIELSTVYEGKEFHLIGLFIDEEHYDTIENMCASYMVKKEQSNIDLVNKLCDMGYVMDFNEIKKKNVKGHVNRAHIAAELVAKGYVESIGVAFKTLLEEDVGLYIPPERFALVDAIRFLRKIDAVSILAHPLKDLTPDRLRQILPELINAGLDGMETMHSSYSDEIINISKKIAKEFNLLESGGSDFHGGNKPGVNLGVGKGNINISDDIFDKILQRRNQIISEKTE